MPAFDFNKTYEQAEKKYNLGKGDYFKPTEGGNRIRLLSACLPHESVFNGKKTFKWLCQVLDRKDGQIKPYFMPNTIYKMIADLQMDPDYAFTEVPMPYDVTINATGAGSKEVKYSVFPARENVALTVEEQNALTAAPSITELQQKIRESEDKKDEASQPVEDIPDDIPTSTAGEDINVEDIPF